jgi:predicted nucleic-acid-binding protein
MLGSPPKPNVGMHAVDTNVIVRYLTGDDRAQADKARAVIGHQPVFVPRTVLLEVEWALRGVYDLATGQIIPALRALAGLPAVSFEDAPLVAKAMDWTERGMDFADALHLAAAAECEGFLTFDKRFARSGARLGGIPVTVP